MATACLRDVTGFFEPPDFSVPRFHLPMTSSQGTPDHPRPVLTNEQDEAPPEPIDLLDHAWPFAGI
jgi:hypothetical protein